MMLEMISISTNQSSVASVENYFSLMDGITTESIYQLNQAINNDKRPQVKLLTVSHLITFYPLG